MVVKNMKLLNKILRIQSFKALLKKLLKKNLKVIYGKTASKFFYNYFRCHTKCIRLKLKYQHLSSNKKKIFCSCKKIHKVKEKLKKKNQIVNLNFPRVINYIKGENQN